MNDNASGFAAAAQPIAAQSVIHTDTAGLADGIVKLTVGGQEVPVYSARPAGQDKLPVMIVVSEIFGLHELIDASGDLRTLPCHLAEQGGMDGFYAARLIRT